MVAARDITARKQAEQQALELKLQQERIKLLTTFFQDASHEFRTPLSIIKTATYIIERLDAPDKRQEKLDQINQQAERIDKLVNDLLLMCS